MQKYQDRKAAGKILAEKLSAYRHQEDVLVLALPRGGVPVAFEIAKQLSAPLDVFIVRKLGVPGHDELAMGAIATGGLMIFNDDIIQELEISPAAMQPVIAKEEKELKRREMVYRGERECTIIKNKTIILVDDGVATGATLRAAIGALKKKHPKKIIVAIPVAEPSIYEHIKTLVDEIYCPLKPTPLNAVGVWYDNFSQTEDQEVHDLLAKATPFKKNPR